MSVAATRASGLKLLSGWVSGLALTLCTAPLSAEQVSLPPLPETISAQARAQLEAASAAPPGGPLTIEQMRAFSDQFQAVWSAKQRLKYAIDLKEDEIAGVPVRIISPLQAPDKEHIFLDLHGGGFILDSGSLTENIPIAALSRIPVIAVRYRLAPEHPFPAAVDDALAVYRALLKKYPPAHIAVYGTSAGAILGPQLISRILSTGLPTPAALGVFSGDADLARPGDSTRLFPFQMGDLDYAKVRSLIAGSTPFDQPAFSPLYGPLAKFPPTLCLTSGRDFLLSSTVNFCRALDRAGVPSHLEVFDGLPHAFWTYIDAPESDEAYQAMAQFLAQRVGVKLAPALTSASAEPASRCEALKALALPGTVITRAEARVAGTFKGAFMPVEAELPAICRIEGHISPEPGSDIVFEVWMPASGWNGRLYGAGNGGFAGAVSYSPGLVEAVQRGGAGVSTDTGHPAQADNPAEDGRWARGHPERIKDYGYRAIHLTAVNAKALVRAFYGEAAQRAYFASCSNGGREAMMEAERYPEDYDGIIAGAPAYDWTGVATDFIWNARALKGDAAIPAAKVPALQTAVRRQCATGDTFVANPRQCHFDPKAMLCTDQDSESCLTAPQAAALRKIYSGPRLNDGSGLYPGFPASGAEVGGFAGWGWDGWILPLPGQAPNQPKYAQALLADFATKLHTDIDHFDFDRDYPLIRSELGPQLDAVDPDLNRFAERGGKLILWHGWADPALPPEHTIDYFEAVERTLGKKKTQSMLRLFMVPGVQHCFGGPGPNSFGQFSAPPRPADPDSDMSAALERWVENGRAPDQLIGHHADNPLAGAIDWRSANPKSASLLCPYPKVAKNSKDTQGTTTSRCE